MDRHLGVGVAGELHAGVLEFAAQGGEVLDDPVVHHGELAGGVAVRVRVAVGGPAVGGPSGVAQPAVPVSASGSVSASASSRLASRPARRRTVSPPAASTSAIPAES